MEKNKALSNDGIILKSPVPLDDGLKKCNVIYYVLTIALVLWVTIHSLFNTGKFNYLGALLAIFFGIIFGWTIKSMIARVKMLSLRNYKFVLPNKYIDKGNLAVRLNTSLTKIGMTVVQNNDGKTCITYKDMIYDIQIENDNTFSILCKNSNVNSLLTYYITKYKTAVSTMGIIAYNLQH